MNFWLWMATLGVGVGVFLGMVAVTLYYAHKQ